MEPSRNLLAHAGPKSLLANNGGSASFLSKQTGEMSPEKPD